MSQSIFSDNTVRVILDDGLYGLVSVYRNDIAIWWVPVKDLAEAYPIHNHALGSRHILDLNAKRGVTTELLYTLGSFIVDIHPYNEINWLHTFYSIEMGRYQIDALRLQRAVTSNNADSRGVIDSEELAASYIQQIEVAEELIDEADVAITKMVLDNLRRYNLL